MMERSGSRAIRKALLLALAALGLWWVAQDSGSRLRQSDFVPYWVAARLYLSGANPYSALAVFQLETQLHLSTRRRAWMMWNPPTALTVVAPFGLLSFRVAATLWFALQFAMVFASSFWLWRIYGGPAGVRWLALVLPGVFLPTAVVLIDCQMTPLVLLGIVAFLHWIEGRSYMLAGVALALVALKPQLCLPLACVVLLWSRRRRTGRLLIGWAAAVTIFLLPVWLHPQLASQYRETMARIWDDAAPAWGGLLRAIFGYQRIWLQYLPVLPGMVWTILYWRKHRYRWDWKQRLPLLLLVGFMAAPYGWTYDEVILVPVFISAAIHILQEKNRQLASWSFAFYLLINLTMFVLNLARLRDAWYIWNVPVWLIGYIVLMRQEETALTTPAGSSTTAHP